jgi:enamine deaminase RidA (YjgF/YER057c/UK114 family)
MSRRSIDVEGYAHAAAIPVASRIGPLLASSIIAGFDPGTRNMPDTAEAQAVNVLHHAGVILAAGGGTWADVVKVNFFVADTEFRTAIEPLWVELFPDAASRPARHHQPAQLPRRVLVQADYLAYIDR